MISVNDPKYIHFYPTFLQPFRIAGIAKPSIKSIEFCLFDKKNLSNIIIDLSYNLSKYTQF